MRYLVTAALLLASQPAFALSDQTLLDLYTELHRQCQIGEGLLRPDLSAEESQVACDDRKEVSDELSKRGYCWNRGEQEWERCK